LMSNSTTDGFFGGHFGDGRLWRSSTTRPQRRSLRRCGLQPAMISRAARRLRRCNSYVHRFVCFYACLTPPAFKSWSRVIDDKAAARFNLPLCASAQRQRPRKILLPLPRRARFEPSQRRPDLFQPLRHVFSGRLPRPGRCGTAEGSNPFPLSRTMSVKASGPVARKTETSVAPECFDDVVQGLLERKKQHCGGLQR